MVVHLQMSQEALDALFDCMVHDNWPQMMLVDTGAGPADPRCHAQPVRWDLAKKYCGRRLEAYMHFGSMGNVVADLEFSQLIKRKVFGEFGPL